MYDYPEVFLGVMLRNILLPVSLDLDLVLPSCFELFVLMGRRHAAVYGDRFRTFAAVDYIEGYATDQSLEKCE